MRYSEVAFYWSIFQLFTKNTTNDYIFNFICIFPNRAVIPIVKNEKMIHFTNPIGEVVSDSGRENGVNTKIAYKK